jgi:hypothetical protein
MSAGLILKRNSSTPPHATGLTRKSMPMSGYMANAMRLPVSTMTAVPKWLRISLSETCLVMPSAPTIPWVMLLSPGGMRAVTAPWKNLMMTIQPRLAPYSMAVAAVRRVNAVVVTDAKASIVTFLSV